MELVRNVRVQVVKENSTDKLGWAGALGRDGLYAQTPLNIDRLQRFPATMKKRR